MLGTDLGGLDRLPARPYAALPSGQLVSYRELRGGPHPDGARGAGRPPLVLLHGAGGSSLVFSEVIGRLAALGRRVVAPDLPGHGSSPDFLARVHPGELLERYRDVVAELGEQLGLGRFILVGHSMGGAVAMLFALTYPERLVGLVLVASAARLKVAPELLWTIRERFDQLPALLGQAGFSPASAPAQVAAWAARQIQAPREVVLADFEACGRFDLRDRITGIDGVCCPTLVISAADDRLTPPVLQLRLSEGIKRARCETVSRAGHFVLWERPDEVVELIDTLG